MPVTFAIGTIAALSMACLFLVNQDPLALQIIFIEMNRLGAMPVLVALPVSAIVLVALTLLGPRTGP